MRFDRSTAAVLVAVLPVALAQTYTDCNPMEKTCPNDPGLSTSSYTADFTKGSSANASWSAAAYTNIEYGDDGAVFTIATKNDAPTIATDFYIFFGRVSVTMKAASGTGIVSSIVLESADLDEIDWEFLGGSNENSNTQTNYFGKGNTTSYDRVFAASVSTPQDTFHTYTVDWTKDRIEWIIDGTTVRTLAYADAVGGKNFPQTPSQLKLGNWAGGASSSEGTVEWAGGATDFSQGPFKMYVQKVEITNYNPACEYKYSDKTGSYESIDKIPSGDSCSAASASTATGTASTSVPSTATSAPTSSQSVGNLEQTKSVVPTTTISATAAATGTGFQTAPSAGTQVPNPTGAGINGTASSTGSGTVTGPTSSSSIASSTGGAALNSVITASSLLSVVLGLLMF